MILTRAARIFASRPTVLKIRFSPYLQGCSQRMRSLVTTATTSAHLEELETELETKRMHVFQLNVVKFPNQEFPLRVFEPRYKIMFEEILGKSTASDSVLQNGYFALVCSRPTEDIPEDERGYTDWKSYNVGTVVEVTQHLEMDNEELLVTCVARSRVELSDVQREPLGYWTTNACLIPPIDISTIEEDVAERAMTPCKQLYSDFVALKILKHTEEEQRELLEEMERSGTDAARLGDWLAARLPVHNSAKQNLLANNDPIWRLLKIANSFRKLVEKYASIEGKRLEDEVK